MVKATTRGKGIAASFALIRRSCHEQSRFMWPFIPSIALDAVISVEATASISFTVPSRVTAPSAKRYEAFISPSIQFMDIAAELHKLGTWFDMSQVPSLFRLKPNVVPLSV